VSITTTTFQPCNPSPWRGRYARIPGDCTAFHLVQVRGRPWPVLLWDFDGRGTCEAVECDAAAALADAVAWAKRYAGGGRHGSFQINESGQVLVPGSDHSGRCYLAGQLSGQLLFENPFCPEELIDLSDNRRLQPGDPWKLPYVGIPHNLHREGRIYFYKQDESGGRMTHPPQQDEGLIRVLRSLRPRKAVRFIVTHGGLVVTKCPVDERQTAEEFWQPVYVGAITPSKWFQKE
jgi:hypothetical protein